jgi:glyoxylase-like metal-dependent hydrolase (beta-lactamase superfamily II)
MRIRCYVGAAALMGWALATPGFAQVDEAASIDMTPGLGPNDAAAPSVIQPDTKATASTLLPANQAVIMGPVSVLQVRPNVYMLTTAQGANFALLTGPQGSVVVDSGGGDCAAVVAAAKQVARGPIRYVFETSGDPDRVGCVDALSSAGKQYGALNMRGPPKSEKAPVYANEHTLLRLSQLPGAKNLPSEGNTRSTVSFSVGGQGIQALFTPAHTDGDILVLFRQADVIAAGNLFDDTHFPVIDLANGGSIQGEINALNRLVDELTIPPVPKWAGWYGTLVIPGRGHLCDQADLVMYRDMLTVIRDRVAALLKQGRTLEQVQAADPTRGYAGRFGSNSGSWTTREFVEAVYKSLQRGDKS